MKRSALIGCLLVFCLVLAGCSIQTTQTDPGEAAQEQASIPVTKAAKLDISSLPLADDASLYRAYDPVDPICFYITVVGGNAADGTDHTFEEVNAYRNLQGMTNVEKIKTEIIFQVGDETGPRSGEVGYSAVGSNATMNMRGRTSTYYPQKSYRIDLYDTAGLWRGQRAIAINKHPGDHTRLRNMLYFELLQDVPGLTSLRTQFVHVYINDRTDPANKNEFVDHGLYTQVELPNGRFLRNHGLSQNGNLYKANLNEMFRYEDKLRLATDPLYDIAAFSEILEPKTSQDHSKLLNMLDMLNDFSTPIEEVAQKHFNIDNLTSYLAFNLLMFNPDSNAQNYLLYSPVNSDCWYYICWDGDGSLSWYEDELLQNAWLESPWTRGVSNYWGVVLFNRLLRTQSFREALIDKVELLRTMITPERIA
ncbi:MAG: spore coat protein CotH, partial [Clostridia bacterium]|nr:spore coat protein CotH [Clostridia bacterium]